MTEKPFSGLLSPVVTPFKADLSPDIDRLARHCSWLLSQNCQLAIFGTNSEGTSLSVEERMGVMDALIDKGIDPKTVMPGTGCAALTDTIKLTRHAVRKGVGGTLMLPPFYYKNVSDEGIYASFAEVIERVGDTNLKVYLYHFPAMSQVPFGIDLIGRLIRDYPETVIGIKDSSGDPENLANMLREYLDFHVFCGTEALLLENMRLGGTGCISATANVNPAAIRNVYDNWQSDEAEALQAGISETRTVVQGFPMIPSLKKLIAHYSEDPDWHRVRPPLVKLTPQQETGLIDAVTAIGFDMPGIRK